MDYARWLMPRHKQYGVYIEEEGDTVFLCASNVRLSQLDMSRMTLPELWREADTVRSLYSSSSGSS